MGIAKNGEKNLQEKNQLRKKNRRAYEANEDKKETEKRMNESRNNCKTKKTDAKRK